MRKSKSNLNNSLSPEILTVHQEFSSAAQRLLKNIEDTCAMCNDPDIAKAERMMRAGFSQSFEIVDAEKKIKEISIAKKLRDVIEYYSIAYPDHSFLTDKQFNGLLEEFSLKWFFLSSYTGSVPEKNLREIESFNLRDRDATVEIWGIPNHLKAGHDALGGSASPILSKEPDPECLRKEIRSREKIVCAAGVPTIIGFSTQQISVPKKIKAPCPATIVLQPLHDGYLVVSKW